MNRKEFLLNTALVTAGAALPFSRADGTTAVEGTFSELRRGVGFYSERGGTMGYLISDEGVVVVDSQYPETARNFLAGLQDRSGRSVDLLINTHHHGDHTGGNSVIRERAEEIMAHQNVPGLMSGGDQEIAQSAFPNITYQQGAQYMLGNETIALQHHGPAHTGGDTVVHFERANIYHMGDLVFNRMNPYTDRPSGASVYNWVTTLETVYKEDDSDDATYIFGHGHPDFGVTGGKEDLLVMRDYLSAMIEHVEQGIQAGSSKEEIIDLEQMEQFPDFQYADWWTLSQNLGVVYEEAMDR